jgi:hypothetical protein
MRVNETEGLLFLLGTGASASAIDRQTAERLKLPATGVRSVEGTAGVMQARQVQIQRLAVGTARAHKLNVPAYDLGGVPAPPGARLDGILGYFARPTAVGFVSNNLLEKFSPVTIDYRANALYLSWRT